MMLVYGGAVLKVYLLSMLNSKYFDHYFYYAENLYSGL